MAHIQLAGENAIIIYFGDQASPVMSQEIVFYQTMLQEKLADVLIDSVPAYTSLLLSYQLTKILHQDFCDKVQKLINENPFEPTLISHSAVKIPVYYDASVGLDLAKVMAEKNLDLATLIALHTAPTYHVYAVGFSPAFAFLGQLDPKLYQARHPSPRVKVPAGSVGIADDQTAIYPIDSPGGWHIIGRTPWDLSLENPDNLTRFKVGQKVKFKAIDAQTYAEMLKEAGNQTCVSK